MMMMKDVVLEFIERPLSALSLALLWPCVADFVVYILYLLAQWPTFGR